MDGRSENTSLATAKTVREEDPLQSAETGAWSMLHIALWEPEIPPNTGNVARLCAATGATLHLIGRLGFRLDDRSLRRAGLDYWQAVDLHRHASLEEFEAALPNTRIISFSAHVARWYTGIEFQDGDCLLFGGESRGLPASLLERHCELAVTI